MVPVFVSLMCVVFANFGMQMPFAAAVPVPVIVRCCKLSLPIEVCG
jgi:hypothetical protein